MVGGANGTSAGAAAAAPERFFRAARRAVAAIVVDAVVGADAMIGYTPLCNGDTTSY
jgi:hypothetical protein